jgi:hypothetical protein
MEGKKECQTGCEVEWTPLRLYLGGIPLECQEEELRQYFEKFGSVLCSGVKRNKDGHSRGCGYVIFDADSLKVNEELLFKMPHIIKGKQVEIKPFIDCEKERQRQLQLDCEKALYICGLPLELTEKGFKEYFSRFGEIDKAYIIFKDGKSRGFGFINFTCPFIAEKVLSKDHMILGKKIGVSRKIAKNDMKKDSTKSGGSRSMGQSSSGKGSLGDNQQDCTNPMNRGYPSNQAMAYQQMGSYPPNPGMMINGQHYLQVAYGMPPHPMQGHIPSPYGVMAPMGPCYMAPPIGCYPVPGVNHGMYQMPMGPCWPPQAGYVHPGAQLHTQKPAFKKPLQPGTRFCYQPDGGNKATSACGSTPAKMQQPEEFDDTYSTISKQVCYSAQGEQIPNLPAKDEKKDGCIFSRLRKSIWPAEKKYDFNPCQKNLAIFTNKPTVSPPNLKGKLGGCTLVKPKGDENEGFTEDPDKAIRDLFSDAES